MTERAALLARSHRVDAVHRAFCWVGCANGLVVMAHLFTHIEWLILAAAVVGTWSIGGLVALGLMRRRIWRRIDAINDAEHEALLRAQGYEEVRAE